MVKILKPLLIGAVLCGGLVLSSCSSSPSDEELKQLADLQKQAEQLKTEVDAKKAEVGALQKQIADRNAALQQCQSDQEAVKKAMGGK
jgi:outer membrane murein-binding lipoprotein Lpp